MKANDIIGFSSGKYEPKTQLEKVVYLLNQLCLNKITSEQAANELQSILSPSEPERTEERTKEDILRETMRCTITEDAPDEDEYYFFQWKDVLTAMDEYATLRTSKVVEEKDREIRTIERHRLEDAASAISDSNFQHERIKKLESEISAANKRIEKLSFMVENGLGWEDLKDDNRYPSGL